MDSYDVQIILRSVLVNVFSVVIFFKIINEKNKIWKKAIIIFISSAVFILCRHFCPITISIIILCLFQTFLIRLLNRENTGNTFLGVFISVSSTYVVLLLSVSIEFIIQMFFRIQNKTINVMIVELIAAFFIWILLKLRKLKDGLYFLKRKNDFLEMSVVNICLLVAIISELITYFNNDEYTKNWYYLFAILGLSMGITIYKTIKLYYKQKLTEDAIEGFKAEIEEKNMEIKRLTEENYKIHKVNHEFYNKQRALEKMVNDAVAKMNMESSDELSLLDRIQEVTMEHASNIESIKSQETLPLTEIPEIDDMFSYMRQECLDNNIEFSFKIFGNIFYMTNNLIPKNKLETMIGDHIRDAIIAINSSKNDNKRIFTTIGKSGEYYELCIFDTGVEFEIETLNKLGIEQITTHKEEGGSGIGFITTFETMKECNASLEVEEIGEVCSNNYTKAIRIVFDSKNEYRIKSYRAKELKKKIDIERINLI